MVAAYVAWTGGNPVLCSTRAEGDGLIDRDALRPDAERGVIVSCEHPAMVPEVRHDNLLGRRPRRRRPKKTGEDQVIGRSRGGLSTKIHALVDALGNPLGFFLTGGHAHDLVGADYLLPSM